MGQKTNTPEARAEAARKKPTEGGFQPAKPWTDYRKPSRKPAAPGSETGSGDPLKPTRSK
jgi:hypothetical protein